MEKIKFCDFLHPQGEIHFYVPKNVIFSRFLMEFCVFYTQQQRQQQKKVVPRLMVKWILLWLLFDILENKFLFSLSHRQTHNMGIKYPYINSFSVHFSSIFPKVEDIQKKSKTTFYISYHGHC
jgi:hypothetical protein